MKKCVAIACLVLVSGLLAAASVPTSQETRFFHDPSVCGDTIAFVHAGDLWSAPLAGGEARPLMTTAGTESRPRFSPDCTSLAFSGDADGNVDIYIVAAGGGKARRLTWHPAADRVEGWSPDGSRILFASSRVSDHFRPRLMTIPSSGGYPEVFPMHKGFRGAFSPDGQRLAFTPIREAFATWKRYRGGETSPIWITDLKDYSHLEIPHENASDTAPVWLGESVYFLSDRDEVMAVFRYDVVRGTVEPVVNHGETDIDSFSASGNHLVYASAGYLFDYDITSRRSRRLPISVTHDPVETVPGPRVAGELIQRARLAPDGSEILFEIRGELVVLPRSGGPAKNVSRSSGSAERDPAWSPDGKQIAYFSDADGEYALYVRDASGTGTPVRIGSGGPGYFYRPVWSPDGRKIAYVDRFQSLWWTDLATRRHTRIESLVEPRDPYVWTPDSRALVFANIRPTQFRELILHELESGASRRLTHPIGDAHQPAFSSDGRYLFFLGSTNVGQVKTGLDLSVIAHENEVTWSVYAVLLRADEPSPFAPTADARPRPSSSGERVFQADWDTAPRRIVRLPLSAARFVELRTAADGALFLREEPSERTFAGEPRLRRFDWEQRKLVDFAEKVRGFELATDGRAVLYRSGQSWRVVTAGDRAAGESADVDVSSLTVHVDPPEEWRQMFGDVWRSFRDFFYDDNLHGIDWNAVRTRYEAYLSDVRHRTDLDYVFRQMVGELVNSHIQVRGPLETSKQAETKVGLLGADFTNSQGRYRITRIVPGTHWDEEVSPLTVPGVDVHEGEYILEVNGVALHHPTSIYSLLAGTAGKPVTLRVGPSASLRGSRLVTVVPIEDEGGLRRRAWVERNRQRVDELSAGTIAYVYQPDTGQDSLREFDRLFFAQSDRQAVIIDERFNDGGGDPDYQLDVLDRQQVHWYAQRGRPPFKSPFSIVAGPKLMLVNAEAGSGGDVYPYQFTLRKLGTTLGTRTWGGVNGGGAGAPLVDGGAARVPDLGTYAPDGSFILENSGFSPDIEVQVYPSDDAAGRDPQLDRAVAVLLQQLRDRPVPRVPQLEKAIRQRSPGSSVRD